MEFIKIFLTAYAAPALVGAVLGVVLLRVRAQNEGARQRLGRVFLLLSSLWFVLGGLTTAQAWRAEATARRTANDPPPGARLVLRGNGYEIYARGDAALPRFLLNRADAGQ